MWSLRQSAALRIPLADARFVVVDLETTGGRASAPAPHHRNRRVPRMEGQLHHRHLSPPSCARTCRFPRFITGLTSITNDMVFARRPRSRDVMPAFRDFLGDAVDGRA